MNTQPVTLYHYRSQEPLSLTDAISTCDSILEGAIALLYSPNSCSFLQLIKGEFEDANGKGRKPSDSLTDVFEARIFTEDAEAAKGCELRWLKRHQGKGEAILLSEGRQSIAGFELIESRSCEQLPQQYLLWGQRAENQPEKSGWSRLAEARIGKLDIPLSKELEEHQRVYLKTYEYMAEWIYKAGDKEIGGNYTIIEERLVKLEVAS